MPAVLEGQTVHEVAHQQQRLRGRQNQTGASDRVSQHTDKLTQEVISEQKCRSHRVSNRRPEFKCQPVEQIYMQPQRVQENLKAVDRNVHEKVHF